MRVNGKFLQLIYTINSKVSNSSEYCIATSLIKRIVTNEDLSMEKVAEETDISQASISRFIRKAGFRNWQEFRENCAGISNEMLSHRKYISEKRFMAADDTAISDILYDSAMNNLMATKKDINLDKLHTVIEMIEAAKSVTFIGDEHALSIFYTLQLDVMFKGIPAFLYKNTEVQKIHSEFDYCGGLVIFLSVEERFLYDMQIQNLEKMKKKGSKIVVFSQQDLSDKIKEIDLNYIYGINGSANDGYFSLQYLSQVLSEMLIR